MILSVGKNAISIEVVEQSTKSITFIFNTSKFMLNLPTGKNCNCGISLKKLEGVEGDFIELLKIGTLNLVNAFRDKNEKEI